MPSFTQLLTILIAGRRGLNTYHATGDARRAVRAGTDLYAAIYFIVTGILLTVVVGFMGLFWLPFLLGLVISLPMTVGGVWLLRRVNARSRATVAPMAPPPVPDYYIERLGGGAVAGRRDG